MSIVDAWSLAILYNELGRLYDAFSTGQTSPLHELPLQYADYALWQHQCLTPQRLESKLNYWKQWFANPPLVLELPTDRPRTSSPSFRTGMIPFRLSPKLTQKKRIQIVIVEALAYQDVPFEQIATILFPQYDLSTPLFRVFMSFLPVSPASQPPKLKGFQVTSLQAEELEKRPNLALVIWEEKNSSEPFLQGWWRYRKDLFNEETVIRLSENFKEILNKMVMNPEQPLVLENSKR